jgi:hypothetical protein
MTIYEMTSSSLISCIPIGYFSSVRRHHDVSLKNVDRHRPRQASRKVNRSSFIILER